MNKLANLAFGHGGNVVTILYVKTKGEGSNLHHRVNGHTGSQTIHVLIWQSGFATDREHRFVFICLFVCLICFCFVLFLFARTALLFHIGVCSPFVLRVPTMVWQPVFGIVTCAQMLMHAIALGSCASATELTGRKNKKQQQSNLAESGTRTLVSIAPGFSVGRSTN